MYHTRRSNFTFVEAQDWLVQETGVTRSGLTEGVASARQLEV